MEKNNLLKALNENEMMNIYGGGYWVLEKVGDTIKAIWIKS